MCYAPEITGYCKDNSLNDAVLLGPTSSSSIPQTGDYIFRLIVPRPQHITTLSIDRSRHKLFSFTDYFKPIEYSLRLKAAAQIS